jgi:hypothetical protein
MRNCYDKARHVNLICFGEIAKDHKRFEVEASGQQMVF